MLVIDNYDSFTYNIVQYLQILGAEPQVITNDELRLSDIKRLKFSRIILSPGWGNPDNSGVTMEVIDYYKDKLPILGVCLGMQCIAKYFGADIIKAPEPFHGKNSSIFFNPEFELFKGLKEGFSATRYHSLVIRPPENSDINIEYKRFLLIGIIVLIVTIPIIIYLYNNNAAFNSSMRFAFEGFFNYSETGTWRTSSTDILKTMYIFPENIKTWFIGDGYFADPSVFDPYFIGKSYSAFYMGIDVGYLRFIYYFGLLGLIAFIVYFVKVTCLCINRFPDYKILFFLIVSINFIIWFKVSTDIFLVFALFLCIDKKDNNYLENKIVSNNQ